MMNQGITSIQGGTSYSQSQGSMNYANQSQNTNTEWPKKRVGSGNYSALDVVLDDGNLVEVSFFYRKCSPCSCY